MTGATTPAPIEEYVGDLNSPDYRVRRDAVKHLTKSRNPDVVPYLVQALQDKTVDVKRQAVRGLGKLKDRRGIQPLIAMLDDPACNVHRPAQEELVRFGKKALPALIDALHHNNERIRMTAAICLEEIGDPEAVIPLVDSLVDPSEIVGKAAARALQTLRDERAREPLAALLNEGDDRISQGVRANIALALAFLGDPRAIEPLEAAFDRQPGSVVWITAGLGSIQDPRVIPVLEKMLDSPSKVVRDCAQHALARQDRGG